MKFYAAALLFMARAANAAILNYTGTDDTEDTYVRQDFPDTAYGDVNIIVTSGVDNTTGTGSQQGLLKFPTLVLPEGEMLESATLKLSTINAMADGETFVAYRMKINWTETSTWNSLVDGINASDFEPVESFNIPGPLIAYSTRTVDVTADVQAWFDGEVANNGWFFISTSSDVDFQLFASENPSVGRLPFLQVTTSTIPPTPPPDSSDSCDSIFFCD